MKNISLFSSLISRFDSNNMIIFSQNKTNVKFRQDFPEMLRE